MDWIELDCSKVCVFWQWNFSSYDSGMEIRQSVGIKKYISMCSLSFKIINFMDEQFSLASVRYPCTIFVYQFIILPLIDILCQEILLVCPCYQLKVHQSHLGHLLSSSKSSRSYMWQTQTWLSGRASCVQQECYNGA